MRFVVIGAGAIGGSIGALLARAGHEVLLVARGAHGDAIRDRGLRLEMPDDAFVVHAPVEQSPAWRRDDVVLLAVKTQDAEGALSVVAPDVPVVCITNGVAAERFATNGVRTVIGAYVFAPGSHLEPGVVRLWASPTRGVLDLGGYPDGAPPIADEVARALRSAGFASEVRDDIMRYKRGKLLLNLGNVIEALCGPFDGELETERRARTEAIACFAAAGLPYEIDRSRVVGVLPIAGETRPGGSTWQSMVRHQPLEVDYLNGEIVALGRAHGVPTPVNARLQQLAADVVARGAAPGSLSIAELEARVLA